MKIVYGTKIYMLFLLDFVKSNYATVGHDTGYELNLMIVTGGTEGGENTKRILILARKIQSKVLELGLQSCFIL